MTDILKLNKESFKRIYNTQDNSWDIIVSFLGIKEDPESINEIIVDMNNLSNCNFS